MAVLEARRRNIVITITQYESTKNRHDIRELAAFAAAVVALEVQMPKLTPTIKSLTTGMRVRSKDFEWLQAYLIMFGSLRTTIDLQWRSAKVVASIVDLCSA